MHIDRRVWQLVTQFDVIEELVNFGHLAMQACSSPLHTIASASALSGSNR
jgi:hypothetical protein